MMILTNRQQRLFDFVKEQHGDQKRKYTNAPYWTHLWNVAKEVSNYPSIDHGIEIALCHDIIEDTECTYSQLVDSLLDIKYHPIHACYIADVVLELTDRYTHKDYPEMNRKARKNAEANRLIGIGSNAQSVKYADIIDNTSSIVLYDPGFAEIYLPEIGNKIYKMNKGVPELHARCVETYEKACELLKNPRVQSI